MDKIKNLEKLESWSVPNFMEESGEIDRTAKIFANGDEDLYKKIIECFKNQMNSIKLVPLTNEIWNNLENTDSIDLKLGDTDKAVELANYYKREWQTKLETIKSGKPMPAPIIFEMNGRYHKVAGNTRLMLAKVLGKTPMVAIIHYK